MHREFWESGFRVFGLHPFTGSGDGATCHCGRRDCQAAGKHPLASNWQHTPEWDADQLDAMEDAGQFETGYGVLCRGLLVIDVDARNGGVEAFERLSQAVPDIADAGLIVQTGSGGGSRHLYYLAPDGAPALVQHLAGYQGLDFKSSGYVVGPSSLHASGRRYEVVHGAPDEIGPPPAGLVEMLRKPDRHRAEYDGRVVDVSHGDIAEMLAPIDPDCDYDTWIRVGMAVHHSTGGTGFALWDEWSARGAKYDGATMGAHWHSFGRSANPVTFGTLAHHAQDAGWRMPVSFVPDAGFETADDADAPREDGLPFDLSGVDLTAPPGFVGDVARWIEAQSRRPRRHIAVAAALVAIGNVAGLRYTDDRDGVTCNLFAFCVAGSRTGKEAIQGGMREIHRATGIAPATHGSIKSEQEIIRNLMRHQAAFYMVDEVAHLLQKIKNAQQKGGAIYLDGVIGVLMSVYSKADGFLLLTGDAKEELRGSLLKEVSQLMKRRDENEGGPYVERRIEQVEQALKSIDQGLDRPFLSMIGFTTPVNFEELVDYQSATNGFIGRALLFTEINTAPRSKSKRFRKTPMPAPMAAALEQLRSGGEYDVLAGGGRVEHYGARYAIPTDARADAMLDAALDWFEDQAEAHKSLTGLEALYLGAYELAAKVSLILAAPEGRRTAEHVRWAFALVRRDVEAKARLVVANDREKDAPKLALRARIAGIIGEDGETLAVVANRLRKHRRQDVQAALDEMVAAGVALKVEEPRAGNRKPRTIYRLTGGH